MNMLIKAGSACPVPQAKVALYVVGGVVAVFGIAASHDKHIEFNLSTKGINLKMQ